MTSKDIPRVISDGERTLSFTLMEFVTFINENRNYESNPLQMNPDFQRSHVWTEAQQISFIETFLKGGARHANIIYLNNPMLNARPGKYREFVCVDGLQRATAIERFVKGEIPAFGTKFQDFEDFDFFRRDMANFGIKVNMNSLLTKAEVLEWYLQINSLGTPHTKEEIERVQKIVEKENQV